MHMDTNNKQSMRVQDSPKASTGAAQESKFSPTTEFSSNGMRPVLLLCSSIIVLLHGGRPVDVWLLWLCGT